MSHLKIWSESQVYGVFEALGLKDQDSKEPSTPKSPNLTSAPSSRQICLPRLSSNSVPPPTGKTTNANLENPSK